MPQCPVPDIRDFFLIHSNSHHRSTPRTTPDSLPKERNHGQNAMTKMLDSLPSSVMDYSPDRRPNRNWAAALYSTMPNPIAPPPLECGCSNCSHLVVLLLMTIIIPRHIHPPPLSLHQSIQQEKKATTLSNSLNHSITPPPSVDDAKLLGSNCRGNKVQVPNL